VERPTWERIQELYYSALPIPPDQRCDFVSRACNSDPDLIREICTLLKAGGSSAAFLETPIFHIGLRIISQETVETSVEPTNGADGLINSIVSGRYLVESLLAKGGMARVYLARDLNVDSRRVVLKVLLDESLRNEDIVRKFKGEIKALAHVAHPGVVTIFDAGELPDKKPYLVMEYVAGITLRELIKPEGLPFERAAFIIRGIGSALSAVHRNEIYHRDLKPENIMIQNLGGTEEQVKVVDFGIAKVKASLHGPTPIESSVTMGTIAYMSPEQLRGYKVSAPSDVYSFAVVAYELLTGRRPFVSYTPADLWEQQRQGIKAKPKALRPRLSEDAEAILLNGLSFEPQARCHASQFGERLSSALLVDAPVRKLQPRRWLTAAAAAVLLFAVLSGSYWAWRRWFGASTISRSLPHRALTYSFTVQKRNRQPYESLGEKEFESGDQFRLNVWSRQAGYLYVFSQGPAEQESFNIIFPTPKTNNGTARLEQNQDFQTNWNTFMGEPGIERLWIVWSQGKVVPLENAAAQAFDNQEGAITDTSVAKTLKNFLSENSKPEPATIKDTAKQRNSVRADGDLLVKLVELEHQ
jgi:serine/threonine protein kinase